MGIDWKSSTKLSLKPSHNLKNRMNKIINNTITLNIDTQLNHLRRYFLFILALILFSHSTANADEWIYTTRPNDTLWDISQKYLKSVTYWERLQQHNSVNVAKQLAPGTRLSIPLEWLKIQPAPALVVSVTGKVELVNTENSDIKTLASKQTVSIGHKLITDTNSSALIQFADGSTLLVQQNSEVLFNTLSSYGQTGMVDTQLRLQQGRIETTVSPMRDSNSRYEITTPAAVAAVRGTQFRIAYKTQQQEMASEVVEGSVNVAAAGVEQQVDRGFGNITEKGKPPQAPIQLLEPPQLNNLPDTIRRLPFNFNWPALTGAVMYQIQISPAEQPESLSFETIQTDAAFTLNSFNDGKYILRVRGVDNNSLEGFNAEHPFEINTDFPVVTLLSPVKEAEISDKNVAFEWSSEKNVRQYHLQIATDIDFTNIIIDHLDNTSRFTPEIALLPNQYYWRVAAIDDQGNQGMNSAIEQFSVTESDYEALWLLLYLLPAFLL